MSSPSPGRRVAVVFHEPIPGGATRSVLRMVPLLEDVGWSFAFWVPRPSQLYDELEERGYDVDGAPRYIDFLFGLRTLQVPPGPARRLASVPPYVRRLHRFLRERAPDLVHANTVVTLPEALIARRLGARALLHAHEMIPQDLRGALVRRIAARHLDETVAVSEAAAKTLAWGHAQPRLVYEAAPVPPEPVEVRARPEPFVVGTVAMVSPRKGSDLFVNAARQILANGDRIRFEMVGPAPYGVERSWAEERMIPAARRLGIAYEPWADVFERFASWDAFVLPSRWDPFPVAMLEAMASGLPVIGTRVDGIAEQLVPGTGILVAPEDPTDLADAIRRLAGQDLRTRAEMGGAARRRVAENFTVERQAERMHDVYLGALAGGP